MTAPLPTSGPLGEREAYAPTNKDLLENAYAQNKVINEVHQTVAAMDGKLQSLSTTVAAHARVIELLASIKRIALWVLAFLGAGGVLSLFDAIKMWWTH